jgi:hypothetical protein
VQVVVRVERERPARHAIDERESLAVERANGAAAPPSADQILCSADAGG